MADDHQHSNLFASLAGAAAARYIRWVERTAWQTKEMGETLEAHYHHHPCIIGMWHGQFLLLPIIKPSYIPADVMLARHRDAAALAEARRAGLGIVMVARQSGRPIVPVAIATSRYLALNTWSRMTINLPYSGLGFAVGPLVCVPRDAPTDGLEPYRRAVEDSLNAATARAFERAGADPTRATPGAHRRAASELGIGLKTYRAL